MVLDDGYAWNGGVYRSLSQLAKAITGTSWNGHRFFGLKAVRNGASSRRRSAAPRPNPLLDTGMPTLAAFAPASVDRSLPLATKEANPRQGRRLEAEGDLDGRSGSARLPCREPRPHLHVVEDEAEFVRAFFHRYLEVGSVVRLKTALDAENVRSPVRMSGSGRKSSGARISRGHLYWILSNPIYVGRLEGRLPRGFCIMRLTDRRCSGPSNGAPPDCRRRFRLEPNSADLSRSFPPRRESSLVLGRRSAQLALVRMLFNSHILTHILLHQAYLLGIG